MGRIMRRDEVGFSLVEVLVVVVILSLLAAISIPIFIHQREHAWNSQLVSALKNAANAMEAAAVREPGVYEDVTTADLTEEGLRTARGVVLVAIVAASDQGYCLSALHEQSGLIRFWDSAEGTASSQDCSDRY